MVKIIAQGYQAFETKVIEELKHKIVFLTGVEESRVCWVHIKDLRNDVFEIRDKIGDPMWKLIVNKYGIRGVYTIEVNIPKKLLVDKRYV